MNTPQAASIFAIAEPPRPEPSPAIDYSRNEPYPPIPSSPQADSRLLSLPPIDEPAWKRHLYLALALATTLAFFLVIFTFFAPGPGNPGIDENAYLVGGKLFARHLSSGLHPASAYAYVGPMWIRTTDGWYYPKYPVGIPALNALAIWLGGGHNVFAAFYTSPVCATLSILGMFLLTRLLAGSFLALLAALALATNSTMLHLALVPSSHAPAICFALWGMLCLISWWKSGKIWIGIAAGLLLGYTVTIRYSEGLLLAPLGIAAILSIRWTRWQSYLRAALPLLAWAVPVGALVLFNKITTGHLTGYDSTHESTGFTIAEFKTKWEFTLQQLYLYGLFFLLPLGILGMVLMFDRAGASLSSWSSGWSPPSSSTPPTTGASSRRALAISASSSPFILPSSPRPCGSSPPSPASAAPSPSPSARASSSPPSPALAPLSPRPTFSPSTPTTPT